MAVNLLGKEVANGKLTVLAEKIVHVKSLHGMIETNSVLPVTDLFGIRLIRQNDNYTCLQVITYGIHSKVSWDMQRRQKVIIKKEVIKEPIRPIEEYTRVGAGSEELF